MSQTIINGDSLEELKQIKPDTIDAVITDPPYGIAFLGKDWDSFRGTRVARSQVVQNLGTGMRMTTHTENVNYQQWCEQWGRECLRVLKPGGWLLAFSAARLYHRITAGLEDAGFEIRDQIMWIYASGFPKAQQIKGHTGWKTALKPAHEPICMARKPFRGSTYNNMDKWGVGALNIDATRIPTADTRTGGANGVSRLTFGAGATSNTDSFRQYTPHEQGRFPSNVMGEVEGYQKFFYCPKVSRKERNRGCEDREALPLFKDRHKDAKALGSWADKRDQAHKNNHPTVKPVELMKYLVRLVTPEGAHIVDPFSGSGSTGMACKELGRQFTGIDLDANYCDIARKRIQATATDPRETLFDRT